MNFIYQHINYTLHLRIKFLLFAPFLISNIFLAAQDIHFTQFSILPSQLSPSFTGFYDGNFRAATIYRNQWSTVKVPYNTLGIAVEGKLLETKRIYSNLSLGFNGFFDQAGDSRLQSIYAQIPLSYNISLPIKKLSSLSIGIGAYTGILRNQLRIDQLQFDNQYTGEVYDPTIPIAENFENLAFTKPDLGIGFHTKCSILNKVSISIGFGIHHLLKTKQSFLNDNLYVSLNKRYSLPSSIKWQINPKWSLQADYLFQSQNKYVHEHLTGLLASYYIQNNYPAIKYLRFGSYYRVNDAVTAIFQYGSNQFIAGISYDANVSKFTKATNSYGAIELSFIYIFKKIQKKNLKYKVNCSIL